MNYLVRCEKCGKKNKISRENISKKLKCGHCNHIFLGSNGVVEVEDNNYKDFVRENNKIIVFYSNTCPYCVGVKNAIKELAIEFPNIIFGQINSSYNQHSAQSLGIRGVPSIYLYKNGAIAETIPGAIDISQFKSIIKNIY